MSRWLSPAHGAQDGGCDNMISAWKLVTNLVKANNLGVEVQGVTEYSKEELVEALVTFIAWVTPLVSWRGSKKYIKWCAGCAD